MPAETIRVETRYDGQVTDITIGPPPANIVTALMIDELAAELDRHATGQKDVKLVVIRGDGEHFSYGASVEEHRPEQIRDVLPKLHKLIGGMLENPVPTLAAVSGMCLGGGFELVMGCTLIFADEGAAFGVPEIKLGVFPPAASLLLPWLSSSASAARIILGGSNVNAQTAHRLGVVTEMAAPGELDAAIDQFIEKDILRKSASSLRFANRALRSGIAAHWAAHIGDIERLYINDLMATADAVEGITSFLEKRKPVWKNE